MFAKKTMAFVAALAALFGSVGVSAATSGTKSIFGNYKMTQDHYGTIVIRRNNVTLDCDGHYIYDYVNGSTQSCGIYGTDTCGVIAEGKSNVTIKNCRIQYHDIGVYVEGGNNNKIRYNSASQCFEGFHFYDTPQVEAFQNYSNNNIYNGFVVEDSASCVLERNIVYSNLDGFEIVNSPACMVKTNLVLSNSYGIQTGGCHFINIYKNGVNSSVINGISVSNTYFATVSHNYSKSNDGNGIQFYRGCSGRIHHNTATGNGRYDLYYYDNGNDPNCAGHNWYSNTYDTSRGF